MNLPHSVPDASSDRSSFARAQEAIKSGDVEEISQMLAADQESFYAR